MSDYNGELNSISVFYAVGEGKQCPNCKRAISNEEKMDWLEKTEAHCPHCKQSIDLKYEVIMPNGHGDWRGFFPYAIHTNCSNCQKIFRAALPRPAESGDEFTGKDAIKFTWRRSWKVFMNNNLEYWQPYCDDCKKAITKDCGGSVEVSTEQEQYSESSIEPPFWALAIKKFPEYEHILGNGDSENIFSFPNWDDKRIGEISITLCDMLLDKQYDEIRTTRSLSYLYFFRGRGNLRLYEVDSAFLDFQKSLSFKHADNAFIELAIQETYHQLASMLNDLEVSLFLYSQAVKLLPQSAKNYAFLGKTHAEFGDKISDKQAKAEHYKEARSAFSRWRELASDEEYADNLNINFVIDHLTALFFKTLI